MLLLNWQRAMPCSLSLCAGAGAGGAAVAADVALELAESDAVLVASLARLFFLLYVGDFSAVVVRVRFRHYDLKQRRRIESAAPFLFLSKCYCLVLSDTAVWPFLSLSASAAVAMNEMFA